VRGGVRRCGGAEMRRCGLWTGGQVPEGAECGGAEVLRRLGGCGDAGVRIAASTFRSFADIFCLPFGLRSSLSPSLSPPLLSPSLLLPLSPPLLLPPAPPTLQNFSIVGECVNSLGARDGGGSRRCTVSAQADASAASLPQRPYARVEVSREEVPCGRPRRQE